MAQIGEFAFILASLGTSLGVTADFLYPVVVAVSIITTFFTPYMIRAALPVSNLLEKVIPDNVLHHLNARSEKTRTDEGNHLWKSLLTALVSQVGAYLTLSIAVITLSFSLLLPLCRTAFTHWPGNIVCGVLTLVVSAPFLRAIVMRKNHSEEWKQLRRKGIVHRLGLWLTLLVRFSIAVAVVYYILNFLSPFWFVWHIIASALLVCLMVGARLVKWASIKLERTFLQNLRSREYFSRSHNGKPVYAARLTGRNIHLASLEVPLASSWGGRSLRELAISHEDGVLIAAIVRGTHRLNVPDGNYKIFPGDRLEVIGNDDSLHAFSEKMQQNVETIPDSTDDLRLRRIIIKEGTPFIGMSLCESGIRNKYHCMVVGFEDSEGNIQPAVAERIICRQDTLWLVGEEDNLKCLQAKCV